MMRILRQGRRQDYLPHSVHLNVRADVPPRAPPNILQAYRANLLLSTHVRPCALLIEVRQTVLTKILSGKSSLERAFVKAIPAARLTEGRARTGTGLFASRMRDVDNPATAAVFHVWDHQPRTTDCAHQFEV